jgi:plasmid stabilization system protein ParE
MSTYILTPEADQDLDDIWEYIALDDIEAADRWDANCATPLPFSRETRVLDTRART